MKQNRRKNAGLLLQNIKNLDYIKPVFEKLTDIDVPLGVPVLVKDVKRDILRKYLINNHIYCPIHWPVNKYNQNISIEAKFICDNEMTLVCDQRYDEKDMLFIVEKCNKFYEENG
ncbi:MAG: hypothetical protein LBS28_05305 [Streptococcaceae bacterium]|nr:hypothetical protein [Streptococcaceae bacterium]